MTDLLDATRGRTTLVITYRPELVTGTPRLVALVDGIMTVH